jgi:hypothetical protein
MKLTFDYQDFKEILDMMNITISDVYFSASAVSPKNIAVYMHWISPANLFNYYEDIQYECGLSLKVKGKWFGIDELDKNEFDGKERLDWIKTQTHILCRYFVDGSGSGSLGSYDPEA